MPRPALVLLATLLGSLAAPVMPSAAQAPAPVTPRAQAPAASTAAAEADFVARINALRAAKGLPRLSVHPELTTVARSWAGAMAKVDRISHNPNLDKVVRADWQKLGENVGVGMTVGELHEAFVASPTHYRNLVEPRYRYIGVGVVVGRGGALFTAHQFMQLRSDPVPEEAAAQTPAAAPGRRDGDRALPPARLILVLQLLQALDAS